MSDAIRLSACRSSANALETVGPNEVIQIPGGLPHEVRTLEDAVVIDVFNPVRQDWIDGTDTYFQRRTVPFATK